MGILHGMRAVNLMLVDGGMGDMVAMLVPVDHLIRKNPKIKFHVWVGDYLLEFAKHVLPPGSLVRPFSQAEMLFNQGIPGLTTEWLSHHTPKRCHPVDYAFHMLADSHIYDLAEKNYLHIRPHKPPVKFRLPDKYVCIGAAPADSVKMMPLDTLKEVVRWALARGYSPVMLGSSRNSYDHGFWATPGMINLINRTTILEAAQVIAGAAAFVGLDGGLVHVAGCTDTEIVAGYTLVDPRTIAPIRKGSQSYKFHAIEPDPDIPNRYFQTTDHFYPEDYRTFPGWERVVASMTADKFISVLEKILP